jgi:hypothetical protein
MSYQLDDPQKKEPQQVNACWGSHPEGRPQPAFHYVKAGYMVRCWINLIKTKDNRLFRSPQAVKCVGSHSGKSDFKNGGSKHRRNRKARHPVPSLVRQAPVHRNYL